MLAFIVAVVLLAQTVAFTAGLGPRRGLVPLGNVASVCSVVLLLLNSSLRHLSSCTKA
jgi:uncharacterized membrane protein